MNLRKAKEHAILKWTYFLFLMHGECAFDRSTPLDTMHIFECKFCDIYHALCTDDDGVCPIYNCQRRFWWFKDAWQSHRYKAAIKHAEAILNRIEGVEV